MDETLHKSLRNKITIQFVTRPGATLLKYLINENEESFTGGCEILLIEILFEGRKDLLNDSLVLIGFGVVISYFVHLQPLIFSYFICFCDVVIDSDSHKLCLIDFRHPDMITINHIRKIGILYTYEPFYTWTSLIPTSIDLHLLLLLHLLSAMTHFLQHFTQMESHFYHKYQFVLHFYQPFS